MVRVVFASQRLAETITGTSSWTIRRRGATGKPAFDPADLVSHGIANHTPRIKIGISFPLNAVTLFAHAANRLSCYGCEGCCRSGAADYQDWAVSPRLAGIIPLIVLADVRIAVPARLQDLTGG